MARLLPFFSFFPSFLSLRRGYYCEGEGEEEVEKPLFPSSRKEVRRKGKACVVLWLLAGGVTKGRGGEVRPRCEEAEGSLSRPNPRPGPRFQGPPALPAHTTFFLVRPTTLHRVPDLTSDGLVHPRFPALSPYVGNNRI